jgi:hypothetical protein
MNLSNYDTIYFNGCSFTEGGGFEDGKHWIKNAYKEQYNFEYKNEKEVCYPTIVQTLLPNIKIINEAKSGSGTERVIRKTWEYIFKHRLDKVKKTIFILELPGSVARLDLFSNKEFKHLIGNIEFNNRGKVNDTQVVFDWIYGPQLDEEYRNKLRRIIKEYSEEFIHPDLKEKQVSYSLFGLANFMLMHNIEFYFTGDTGYTQYHLNLQDDYPTFNNEHILQLNIDSKYYNNIVRFAGETKTQICDEIGVNITPDGHPGFQAHKQWGEAIVEFLNNKYL